LGIKEGMRVALDGAPAAFWETLGDLPRGVDLVADGRPADLILCFATDAGVLDRSFRRAMGRIPAEGVIWAAWPKRASRVPTDITEDRLRDMFLPTGMVDVKVAAVDEVWSGLKFVVRTENRAGWRTTGPHGGVTDR
jgi:hypothetical protein